jgi:hypothetical protein
MHLSQAPIWVAQGWEMSFVNYSEETSTSMSAQVASTLEDAQSLGTPRLPVIHTEAEDVLCLKARLSFLEFPTFLPSFVPQTVWSSCTRTLSHSYWRQCLPGIIHSQGSASFSKSEDWNKPSCGAQSTSWHLHYYPVVRMDLLGNQSSMCSGSLTSAPLSDLPDWTRSGRY